MTARFRWHTWHVSDEWKFGVIYRSNGCQGWLKLVRFCVKVLFFCAYFPAKASWREGGLCGDWATEVWVVLGYRTVTVCLYTDWLVLCCWKYFYVEPCWTFVTSLSWSFSASQTQTPVNFTLLWRALYHDDCCIELWNVNEALPPKTKGCHCEKPSPSLQDQGQSPGQDQVLKSSWWIIPWLWAYGLINFPLHLQCNELGLEKLYLSL